MLLADGLCVEPVLRHISTFSFSPVEKQQIAKKVESNANIVGGVCAKDGDADGEKGGVVEGDQAVHDHLQGVVVLVGIRRRLRKKLFFYRIFSNAPL